MENFDWTCFTRKSAIKTSVETIYNAWTKSEEIEKWFLSKADYFREEAPIDKSKNTEAGDTYQWNWYLYLDTEKGKVTQANGVDHFQFTFAGDCIVDVNLRQEDEYVIVSLTQKNIPTDDASKKGIRLGCDTGWSFYLVNLKSVYEGGLDLRNKDENLKELINN